MRFGLRLPLFRSLSLFVTLDNARVWAASIYLLAPFASVLALYAARHTSGYPSLERHAVQSMFLFLFEMMTFCSVCIGVELIARANVWLGCLALSFFFVPLLTRAGCAVAAFIHPDGVKFPLIGSLDATVPNASAPPHPRVRPTPNHPPTQTAAPDVLPRSMTTPPQNTKPPVHKPPPSSVVRPPTARQDRVRQADDPSNAG
ncbi:MAG: hypothetical protein HY741_08905 [Chloroflexi bacterium]|nr:hypothetical protein [Chloroflexota bacterium]